MEHLIVAKIKYSYYLLPITYYQKASNYLVYSKLRYTRVITEEYITPEERMKPKISPKTVKKNPGYSRLSDDEVKENLVEIIRRVMVEKERIVVELNGEEVAAIVPIGEFERLDYLLNDLKPSEFNPDEEDYYANEKGIHCMRPEQIIENIEEILAAIAEDNELFGLLPPSNLGGKKVDIFMPVAIMMSMDFFWIPDYLMAAKNELEV